MISASYSAQEDKPLYLSSSFLSSSLLACSSTIRLYPASAASVISRCVAAAATADSCSRRVSSSTRSGFSRVCLIYVFKTPLAGFTKRDEKAFTNVIVSVGKKNEQIRIRSRELIERLHPSSVVVPSLTEMDAEFFTR